MKHIDTLKELKKITKEEYIMAKIRYDEIKIKDKLIIEQKKLIAVLTERIELYEKEELK